MRLNLKKSFFIGLFCLSGFGLSPAGFGQTYRIEREWPAESGLQDVLIGFADNQLRPTYYLYNDRAISAQKTGEILAQWQNLSDISLSPDRNLCGVFTPGKPPTGKNEPRAYEFKVYDANGKETFRLNGMLLNTAERPFYFLTGTKKALIACSYWGEELLFYNHDGDLLNERRFLQDGTRLQVYPKGAFDDNGRIFLFNLSRAREEEQKVGPDLFMFMTNGSRLWQYQLPLKTTGATGLSRSGRITVVSGAVINPRPPQPAYQTILFDSLGKIINSFPVAFRHYDFDRNDKWLLLGDRYTFHLITLVGKSIYLQMTPGNGRRTITDCALLAGNRILILIGVESSQNGTKLFDDPEILIYSADGQILFRQMFESDYTYRGKLIFNDARDRFGITLQNRFVVFGINP